MRMGRNRNGHTGTAKEATHIGGCLHGTRLNYSLVQ